MPEGIRAMLRRLHWQSLACFAAMAAMSLDAALADESSGHWQLAQYSSQQPYQQQQARRRAQAQAGAQKRAKAQAQQMKTQQAAKRAQAEAQKRAQAEAQKRAHAEAQKRAQAEAQKRAQAEAAAKQAEAQRKAQEAAMLEAQRKAQEAARLAEEKKKAEEAARIAEEKKKAEAAARLAEEKKKAEAAKQAQIEAQKKAQEAARLEAQRKAQEAAKQAEALRRPGAGAYFNKMGQPAMAPPPGQPQGQPRSGNMSKEDQAKLIISVIMTLLDPLIIPETAQYAQAGGGNVDPNAPQSDVSQGRSREDVLERLKAEYRRRKPGADEASISAAAERSLKKREDAKAKADADPEFAAILKYQLDQRQPGQTVASAIDEANKIWEAKREQDRQAEEAARKAAEKAEEERKAEEARKAAELAKLNSPEYQKKVAIEISQSYEKELADWREHHSQTLPDGTWGLVSEYNEKQAQKYKAETGVDVYRAWDEDETRKGAGLEPVSRIPPLPPRVPFIPQGDPPYRYTESDQPPVRPSNYIPPDKR